MDKNTLSRLEALSITASSQILDAKADVWWYQSALQQKTNWARKLERDRNFWRGWCIAAFASMLLFIVASTTALAFR